MKSITHGEFVNDFPDSLTTGKEFLLRQYNVTGYAAASICPVRFFDGLSVLMPYVFYCHNNNRFILTIYVLIFRIAVCRTMSHYYIIFTMNSYS